MGSMHQKSLTNSLARPQKASVAVNLSIYFVFMLRSLRVYRCQRRTWTVSSTRRLYHLFVENWKNDTPPVVNSVPFNSKKSTFSLTPEQSRKWLKKVQRADVGFHQVNTTNYDFPDPVWTLEEQEKMLKEQEKALKEQEKSLQEQRMTQE